MKTSDIDIEKAVKRLVKYWCTYHKQSYYTKYSDSIFIDDAIYGLGIAIDDEKYRYASGNKDFRKFLLKYLQEK